MAKIRKKGRFQAIASLRAPFFHTQFLVQLFHLLNLSMQHLVEKTESLLLPDDAQEKNGDNQSNPSPIKNRNVKTTQGQWKAA
ncbi:MAG: hypothetical protein R2751_05770 [Bacteroidales bacterium]